ncbi:Zinc finger MYM-type protein 1 [Merluccius polli]|uniref:Zinc finger MYM-type protein 1 n=1 Tax=Merluccius polli TaxID=89951 RepID=A0AA47P0U4_MERPO|nr:Zinc finger MYM-type protein 1 [Merluccius polli]
MLKTEERHFAEACASQLLQVANEWEITGKVTTIGTDSARNMIAAARSLPFEHLPCAVSWFAAREWLEYSCEKDSIFCYACRNFGSNKNSTDAFTTTGYNNWRHALSSKEHMKSVALWKERRARSVTGTEISTLVNTAQLERNRTAAIVDIIQFIALNQLPFRGSDDALDARGEVSSGIFLALMDYTLKKDKDLARIFSTIPANATYTSHHIQNEIIEIMSTIITEEIVKDIGEAWYTLKVDGTKDPTGCENVSIVLRYVDTSNTVRKRLVSMATSKQYDAMSLTQLVLAQLRDIGLNTAKVLSQCYDGASVMSGVHGGMQKIMQEELQREVPYVHCFNHQLHLVVVHAMSSDFTLENFFSVCNSLYKYFKKPTVAAVYTGEKLKRLLEQRWTGHLATVTVILKSFGNIVHLLRGIDSTQTSAAEVRMEATGLLKAITQPSFLFIACMTHQILSLLDPPNTALQAKSTDLYTGVRLKRPRNMSHLSDYVVDTTVGHRQKEVEERTGCKRLYFSTLDAVVGEMKARFSVRNSQLVEAPVHLTPRE